METYRIILVVIALIFPIILARPADKQPCGRLQDEEEKG